MALVVCAAEAFAPTGAVAQEPASARAENAPRPRALAEPDPHRPAEQERADAIAGGKLLLSKRLKLIIKYHQVIPA